MCARRRERSCVCDGRRRGISDVLPVANMHVLEWNRVYIGGDMSVYRYCSKKNNKYRYWISIYYDAL